MKKGTLTLLAAASITVIASLTTAASAQSNERVYDDKSKTAPVDFPAEPFDPARAAAAQAPPAAVPSFQKPPASVEVVRGLGVTQVHFDEPGDGSLWALGNSYKCRFNAGGFTFVPYLGSDAPRNFPISFSLQSVAGDSALALQPATVTRDGNRVTINHGPVQEVYILNLESVEQQFIFANRPSAGDVTITLAVESDLQKSDAGAMLHFANEHGRVDYTEAVTVDAASARAAAPTALVKGNVEITIPASTLASAAYPLTVDPLISVFEVEPGTGSRQADVAYDDSDDGYLVAYEFNFSAADGDVLTERYDYDGTYIAGSTLYIDVSLSDNWRRPRIANCNRENRYLVVGEVGAAPNREIWGRTRDASSNTQSAQFQVSVDSDTGDKYNADVGGDPFTDGGALFFLVVYEREFTAGSDYDVHGRLVNPVTSAVSGGTIFIDNSGGSVDTVPSISNSNAESDWFVAWQRTAGGNGNIMGARVGYEGTINQATFSVDTSTSDNRNPAVSSRTNAGNYLVVYEENPATDGDIWGREFSGTSIVSSDNLTLLENVNTDEARANPAVETDGDRFMVAYRQQFSGSDWDAYVSSLCSNPLRVGENHVNLEFTGDNASDIKIGSIYSGGGGIIDEAMIVFARLSGAFGSISGARVDFHSTCCASDLNEDGTTDVNDLLILIGGWGFCDFEADCPANINGDFAVDVNDLLLLIGEWGLCL